MNKFESQPNRYSEDRFNWVIVRTDIKENFGTNLDETTVGDYFEFAQEPFSESDPDRGGEKEFSENIVKILKEYMEKGWINEGMSLQEVVKVLDSKVS